MRRIGPIPTGLPGIVAQARPGIQLDRLPGVKRASMSRHDAVRPGVRRTLQQAVGPLEGVEEVVEHEEREEVAELHRRVEQFFVDEVHQHHWDRFVEEIVVAEGKTTDQILRYVDKTGADLVVMGSHRYGLLDVLLRTTSQRVIAKGRVPVLVVPIDGR